MSVDSIYKTIENAKNGSLIPVFQNGRTMESRYNPERDAEKLCSEIQKGSFFVVMGLGSGIFIQKLSEKFPASKIIVLEKDKSDLLFLKQLESVKRLTENKQIIICTPYDLFTALTENYMPAKFGDLQIIEQRGWVNENSEASLKIKEIIKKAVSIISADYSVQSHFGRLWTHNIMNNIKLLSQTCKSTYAIDNIKNIAASGKEALVVAAGPTLDTFIEEIRRERQKNEIFIIATDTAWSSLTANNIKADTVVSIDGQSVSYNHFIHPTKKSAEVIENCLPPLFFFDLCSNTSAAQHIIEDGADTVFFTSGHPLSMALKNFSGNSIPCLFSGSGTVTITATDLAIKAGFKKIKIVGADFSYSSGKAYTKGTYLDRLYNMNSIKTQSGELSFSRLMYRSKLKPLNNIQQTTEVLEAYRTSLENFLNASGFSFERKMNVYECSAIFNMTENNFNTQKLQYNPSKVDSKAFKNELQTSSPEEIETLLLPYIAYLRHHKKHKDENYIELLKLAFSRIVSYNI